MEKSLIIKDVVGNTAGLIWKQLHEQSGGLRTVDLKKDLLVSNSMLFAAIGWLFRENKIELVPEETGFIVKLIG
ncbi:MAG: winged helix-turn-helix domain-containing protein [Elusimicrobiota bacterium]